jgi:hypothetical protein
MKYVETVEANIWDSTNEAQVDKIIDWLTLSAPGMFAFEDDELRIQTGTYESKPVRDGDAIILSRNGLDSMRGDAFKSIYDLLVEE